MSKITLICGPMFSSDRLYDKIGWDIMHGMKVALVHSNAKWMFSLRENEVRKKCKEFFIDEFTQELVDELTTYSVVAVEGYDGIKGCDILCKSLLNDTHCDAYFSGLLASNDGELVEEAVHILPLVDDIVKVNGLCEKCQSVDGLMIDETKRCLCRNCWLEEKKES